jgi:hypothetical protein
MVNIGGDNNGITCGRYRFVNNTFVFPADYNDYVNEDYVNAIRITQGIDSLEIHNNAFYMVDGGLVNVVRDSPYEMVWTNIDGGPVIAAHTDAFTSSSLLEGNSVTSNTYLPDSLTGLTAGAFRDVTGEDVRPSDTSYYLQGSGTANPASPSGHAFDGGLWPPAYLPPLHMLEKVGTARPWAAYNFPTAGPDVGAYSFPYRSRIAAGADHACGVYSDGCLTCWGRNTSGQLGDGTFLGHDAPECDFALSNVIEIAANMEGSHTCALLADGTVKCWGANTYGQLGDGTTTTRSSPTAISGLSNIVSIAAGASHTCAVFANGDVSCWGRNNAGQLGDGTTTDRHSPTSINSLSNVVSIAAGAAHTCAVLADGGVSCWGSNGYGQLGDGTTTDHHSPVMLSGVSGALSLAAGDSHTCARFANSGAVQCWGFNGSGQLGDGSTTDHHSPISVTVSNSASVIVIA